METYFEKIIPKIKKFSQKLDNLTLLMNHSWEVINGLRKDKYVYLFRDNSELLMSNEKEIYYPSLRFGK